MNIRQKKLGDAMAEVAVSRVVRKGLIEQVGSQGGYLVPVETALAIDEGLRETSIFHMLARQQPMTSNECWVPMFDVKASHATGASPLFGGMQLIRVKEGVAVTESEPLFSGTGLKASTISALVYATNQLVQDAGEPLGAYLEWQFTEAIRWTVESLCFNGNGVGEPAGIVSSQSTAPVNRAGAGHIATADAANMVASLLPACFARAAWCASVTAFSDIAKLSTYVQTAQPNSGPLVGSFYGRPLYVTEKLPPLGTRGDLVLFDPGLYVLGTRQYEVERATEAPEAFYSNMTIFRLTWRGDGQPMARGTATLADGSTVCGAIVALV